MMVKKRNSENENVNALVIRNNYFTNGKLNLRCKVEVQLTS